MSLRITSDAHPYRCIDILHVISETHGRLALSIAPGKQDKRWERDLEADLTRIRSTGIQVIVCLLEWHELNKLALDNYPWRAQEVGFIFYHLPIRDRSVPPQKDLNVLIPLIIGHLQAGHNVLIHCRGGLGRAGMICACCLTHFGYDGEQAINIVRYNRPGAVQTTAQEYCVIKYAQIFKAN